MVQVAPGIFEGYKPRTQADFNALRARGIRTILSLEALPWDIGPERRHAQQNGFLYYNTPIAATPLPPSEKRVKAALQVLANQSLRPTFMHCMLGEDRTTFVAGLYRMYYEDWTPETAWAEMLRNHFHVRLTLRGFDTYFWRHTRRPDWARVTVTDPAKQTAGVVGP